MLLPLWIALLPALVVAADAPAIPPIVHYVAPNYPELYLLAGGEGSVTCIVHIKKDGHVELVECPETAEKYFARAAETAWKKTVFAPPMVDGAPHAIQLSLTTRFSLQAQAPDEAAPNPILDSMPTKISVDGEVLESGERKVIPGCDVIVEGLGLTTLTDKRGLFHFDLPPGEHTIIAIRADYKAAPYRFTIAADSKGEAITIHTFRREVASLEATVRAKKEVTAAPSETSIPHEELRNVPGANNDPVRVIENLPGVARAPYAGGQLVVRGAQPQDTGAFFDGQKIPILYHLLNGPSVLSEEMVERIDFLPGGVGVYFGRQLAGIVDVVPRSTDTDRLHGSAAIDLNKTSAFLRGPIGDSTQFAVGGRFSYVNPALALTAKNNETYQVPLYWDYQGRIDQELPDLSKLTFTAFGSGDSFTQINPGRGTEAAYSDQQIHFHRFQVRWDKELTPNLLLMVAPQAGFGSDVTATTGQGAGAFSLPSEISNQTKDAGLRSQLTFKLGNENVIHAGVDASYQLVDYQVDEQLALSLTGVQSGTTAEEVRAGGTGHFGNLGLYADASIAFGDLRITPGIRVDVLHWTGATFAMTDPRIWARYQLTKTVDLFAYAGVYHQAPTAAQLDPKIGNPFLVPERANQYGVGSDFLFGGDWSVRLEGFYQNRNSLPFAGTPTLKPDGSVNYPLLVNSGIARSVGLELMIRRELTSRIYGWIAYTLSRSQQLERPGFQWGPTDYDQPHVFTALIAYRRSNNAEISARFRIASGNPVRNVTGAVFDGDTGNYLPYNSAFGAGRLPPFVQLDFQVNNLWTAENFRLSMYIEFDNLLNRNNAEGLSYDYRFANTSYVPGQPLNASIGAKVAF